MIAVNVHACPRTTPAPPCSTAPRAPSSRRTSTRRRASTRVSAPVRRLHPRLPRVLHGPGRGPGRLMAHFDLVCKDCKHKFDVVTRAAIRDKQKVCRSAARATSARLRVSSCATARSRTRTAALLSAARGMAEAADQAARRAVTKVPPSLHPKGSLVNVKRLILVLGLAGFIVMADNWVVAPLLPTIAREFSMDPARQASSSPPTCFRSASSSSCTGRWPTGSASSVSS